MIESQRRLAALGLFRRVRITELPRTGSLTRDVLVDLEEADDHDDRLRRRLRGRPHCGARDDEGGGAIDELDVGPRGFFAISRRNLWGKNRSVTLFGRVTLRPRGRRSGRSGATTATTASTTIAACSPSASRARSAPPATRSSPPSSSRAAARASASTAGASPPTTRAARRLHGRPAATPSITPSCSTSRSRRRISC